MKLALSSKPQRWHISGKCAAALHDRHEVSARPLINGGRVPKGSPGIVKHACPRACFLWERVAYLNKKLDTLMLRDCPRQRALFKCKKRVQTRSNSLSALIQDRSKCLFSRGQRLLFSRAACAERASSPFAELTRAEFSVRFWAKRV